MTKLTRKFYQRSAIELAPKFLGKFLVYKTPKGVISGMIVEVEAYPAFVDDVSHGNKRTPRTEIMYSAGGYAYVYLIYGIHHQFAVVVNKVNIPEVVFVRAVKAAQGVELLRKNFGREMPASKLTGSPGSLCKSFGITLSLYGEDLTRGKRLFIEDRGVSFDKEKVILDERVGIRRDLEGGRRKLRFRCH